MKFIQITSIATLLSLATLSEARIRGAADERNLGGIRGIRKLAMGSLAEDHGGSGGVGSMGDPPPAMKTQAPDPDSSSSGPRPNVLVTPDIAMDKQVQVSSSNVVHVAGQPDSNIFDAKHLVDGDSGTRWQSRRFDNQSIEIDLSDTFLIDMVRLNWEVAHAQSYELHLSSDGSNWMTVESTDNSQGGFEEVTFERAEARYVRLNLLTRATQYGFSLWDFEVYKAQETSGELTSGPTQGLPAPTTPDLARNDGARVLASTTYKNWNMYDIQHIVDGNSGTRWASDRHHGNQKIYVDLGETHAINRIRIGWEAAHAKSYEVFLSPDGNDWITVYSTENCQGGIEDLAFESQEGRYIHVNLLTPATEFGFSIWDFEVYEAESAL